MVQLESKPLPRIHYHPSPGNLISGHPQGLPLEGVGYDFCCGEAGTGGTCSLVGAGWEVVSRAESLDLEAQGLLKPPNGHCDAGPGLKAMRGLLKQLPVWGTGHCMWPRQRRAMCCREERTKCVPGWTLAGETLGMSPGYRASRPQIQALQGLNRTVFLWLCHSATSGF